MREGSGKTIGTGWYIHSIRHVVEANLGGAQILITDLMLKWPEEDSLLAGHLVSQET
jgi:hypothetical protein